MEIDEKTQKAIDEYVEKVQDKEDELLAFKKEVNGVLSLAKDELETVLHKLDQEFGENTISEEVYINKLKENKKNIISKVEKDLNNIIQNLT